MGCQVKDTIEELAKLAEMPGMAKYKTELEELLKEVERIRNSGAKNSPIQEQYKAQQAKQERTDKAADSKYWKMYTTRADKADGKYDLYYGAIGNIIEKMTGVNKVTEVVGLMLERASKGQLSEVTAGQYSYETHTVELAKKPTKEEINAAADSGLLEQFIKMYEVTNENMSEKVKMLEPFMNENKARVLQNLVATVESVNGGHAVTHELIHAGALRFMKQNPKHEATMRINELYKEVINQKDEVMRLAYPGDVVSTYWQTNVDEFLAEALSNPGLMYALSQIKTDGKKKLSKGMLHELVNTLIGMLGLDKKVKDSLLEFTMDGFAAIIEAQAVKVEPEADGEVKEKLAKMIVKTEVPQDIKAAYDGSYDNRDKVDTRETVDEYNTRKINELKQLEGTNATITKGDKFASMQITRVSQKDGIMAKVEVDNQQHKEYFKQSYTVNAETMKMVDGEYEIEVSRTIPTRTYGFGDGYHKMNKAANKYVADLAVATYDASEGLLGPKIKDLHKKLMRESKVYAKTYNTIKDGTNDIEVLNKIMHTLFLTGDTPRAKVAKLTKLVEDSNRAAMEILTDEMPEWDKKLLEAVKGDKEQILLMEVYGLSGYGALSGYYIGDKSIAQLLNEGQTPQQIIGQLNLNENEQTATKELYERLVNKKVQESRLVNAGRNDKVAAAVVLEAMMANDNAGYKLHEKMKKNHTELHNKLVEMTVSAYTINNMVNKGLGEMAFGNTSEYMYTDYEGHGLLDLYSNSHEFKIVTEAEMNSGKYTGKMNPWEELKKPNKGGFGIVFRKSQEIYEQGLGVNMDRIKNGLYIDRQMVEEGVKKDANWLVENNVQEYVDAEGNKSYRVVLTKEQAKNAEGMNNVMQALYRSVIHNTQLVEQQSMRKLIKAEMTEDGTTESKLTLLEKKLEFNKRQKRENRKEIKAYLNTRLSAAELEERFPLIAAEYRVATGVSQYEGLSKELRYVRKGLKDMMTGFRSGTIIHDSMPWLQDIERKYKQLVVLKKLKMVVASPTKLIQDIMSNSAILMALDVDPIEGGKNMKEAFDFWNSTSGMEAEIVKLKMELINAEAAKDDTKVKLVTKRKELLEKKMQSHPFYDAYKYGFVQSMATSMMIKEFDTVSGLQHTIDEVVKKFTTDDKHKPNEIHKAIVAFMHWGYSLEDIIKYTGNSSKLNGTMLGDELVQMGNRLADHKKAGEEDVPAYVSEIIAGPQSEIVRQGSRVMQMGDLSARWALYKHTLKEMLEDDLNRVVEFDEVNNVIRGNRLGLPHKKVTELKEKAAMRSLDTFVDYRLNLPSELKKASDLGILWFPSYWLRNTVVIPQIIAAKPLNSMVTMAISGFTGLDTVYESHPLWKLVSDKKSLVHAGMDVTTADTFIPWVP